MESKIKPIYLSINQVLKEISSIEISLANKPNRGVQNSLLKSLQMKRSKLSHLFKKLDDLTRGTIVYVTFRVNQTGDTYQKIYTNLSKRDVELHLKTIFQLEGYSIDILEIKETSTHEMLTKL